MKIKYKIAMCVFLFIVGTAVNVLWSNMVNASIRKINLSDGFFSIENLIGNIFSDEQLRKLFGIFELVVLLLCGCYFFMSQRPYQAKTFKVTNKIKIPIPYGQGQHGTAWFMTDKDKERLFSYVELSAFSPAVSELCRRGDERFKRIESGHETESKKSVINERIIKEGGIVLARNERSGGERLPCITEDVHTLTIGATRCGKSRCLVIQSICTLALAGEGIVANDPKGELYHYTHELLESLGYTVRVMDFNSPKKSDRYNPLQMIIDAYNDGRVDDAQTYAWDFVTFIVEKNEHSEPIWTNGEMAVVAAAVLCVVCDNKDRPEYQNLTNVYEFIANMCKTVNKVMPIDAYMQKLPDGHPAKSLISIAKIAPDRMGGSFYTSALTTLRLFVTNDMYLITRESEFSLEDFGKKPKQALFFILPDQKATFYPIVTLLVSQQYEQLVTFAKKCGNRLPHRVNFVLDEFGNFAAITDFQIKMTVAGGYGIRWNLFIQDFNQLIDKYGQEVAGIIRGNCHYWIYLASLDFNTREEISKSMGSYTTSTYSLGGTIQKYSSPSSSTNIQLSERKLMLPEEVGKIERPYQIVLSQNSPAIMTAPDLSKWLYNRMLGLGNKDHNTKLIKVDEDSRPERGGYETERLLWKPWLDNAAKEEQPEQAAGSDRGLHRTPFFRKGGI